MNRKYDDWSDLGMLILGCVGVLSGAILIAAFTAMVVAMCLRVIFG